MYKLGLQVTLCSAVRNMAMYYYHYYFIIIFILYYYYFIIIIIIIIGGMHVCLRLCTCGYSAQGGQKRALDPLELAL